ncbi:MAG: hypothetical protein AAF677_16060 [Pseudomonadota bacterium]
MTGLALTIGDRAIHATLRLEKFASGILLKLSSRSLDLIDIAATVYAADAAVARGGPTDPDMGARWRRRFALTVPVREPAFWSQPAVRDALSSTLALLSEDDVAFTFTATTPTRPRSPRLDLAGQQSFRTDEALLFSGGLDSLAGALEEMVSRRHKVLLVSHRSSTKIQHAQNALIRALGEQVGQSMFRHIPLSLETGQGQSREDTHRTRSFFFAAPCAGVVDLWGLDRLRSYENGIVSMTLPISGQVVTTRATPSTHPAVLSRLSALFTMVFERPIGVDNPLFWKTKTDVVRLIGDLGAGDLIRLSRRCGATREMTVMNPHCGVCSQCIDRRTAMLAAGVAADDPVSTYDVDPLRGDRTDGRDREMALGYIEAARRFATMDPRTFFSTYGEAQRAAAHLGEAPGAAAERLFMLHKRHGEQVSGVIAEEMRAAVSDQNDDRPGSLSPIALAVLEKMGGAAPVTTAQSTPPAPDTRPEAAPTHRLSILSNNEIEVTGLGTLSGASASLLLALATQHLGSLGRGLPLEEFPCLTSHQLADTMGVSDETVRRRVNLARRAIRALALDRGGGSAGG